MATNLAVSEGLHSEQHQYQFVSFSDGVIASRVSIVQENVSYGLAASLGVERQ